MSVKEPGKRLPTFREKEFSGPCTYMCSKCWVTLRVESPESPDIEKHEAIHTEHARLQSAVVEAAKPWRKLLSEISVAFQNGPPVVGDDLIALNKRRVGAEVALLSTVDALIAFEAENKIGVEDESGKS